MKPVLPVATHGGFGSITLALMVTFGAVAVTAGCGSKSGTGVPENDAGSGADASKATYPAGPYGVGAGKIIEDATFYGYPAYDQRTLGEISLHDFYNPDATKTTTTGAPLATLFVSVGAMWCGPCVAEANSLPALAAKYQPAGVQFVQDLFEGENRDTGAAATQPDLDKWLTSHNLPFPVFIDPSKKLSPYFDVSTLPYAMLIDPTTMKLLADTTGFASAAEVESFLCTNAATKPSVCP